MALALSNPRLLFTVHMYTFPLSSLLRFVRRRDSDVDTTLPSPCLVHVMSGCGLPVALQNKVKRFPSTTSSSDGADSIFGGTKEEHKLIKC